MNKMVRQRLIWLAVFVAAMLMAPLSVTHQVDEVISTALRSYGAHWPPLQLIWVVGGAPLTLLLVLLMAWTRARHNRPWSGVVVGFIVGTLAEVLVKHWIPTPTPSNVVPPPFYRSLITATNIDPQQVMHWVALVMGRTSLASGPSHLLKGTFPSGHLFRLSYVTIIALQGIKQKWWVTAGVLVAAFAVVATGGHWFWDTVGGYALAQLTVIWLVP